MKKAKVTCTATIIIPLDPSLYENGPLTTQQMLDIEKGNFEDDQSMIFDFEWDNYTVTVEELP